jgi:hypothetical protein
MGIILSINLACFFTTVSYDGIISAPNSTGYFPPDAKELSENTPDTLLVFFPTVP